MRKHIAERVVYTDTRRASFNPNVKSALGH